MDVTPQVINEVEFHQKMRGYDPDEVDDFLERIAVAVGQLHDRAMSADERVAAAEHRAADAERRVREAGTRAASGDDETETIRRTLVLAQRTADAAVKEAQDEARRLVESAQAQVDALLADAQAKARQMVADAETEARKTGEDTRQRLIEEIGELETTRDALQADHGILERHLEEQRLRLRSSIGDLQRLLEDPARLRAANAPDTSGATVPAFATESADASATERDEEHVIDLDAISGERAEVRREAEEDVEVERPITGGVTFSPPEEPANGTAPWESGATVAIAADDDDGDEGAWSRFVRQEMLDRPTAALDLDNGDDAYLSELRKAMLDDTSPAGGERDERRARPRFGRRR